jgi:hypothetical protein
LRHAGEFPCRDAPNLGAIEPDAAATGNNEVRDEPHQGRLAATGLPDKTDRLARSYRKSTLSTAWSQLWRARRQKWVLRALYREMLGQAADLEDRLSHKGCQQATTCDWPGRGDDTAQYVAPDGVGSAPMSGRWRRKGVHRVGGERIVQLRLCKVLLIRLTGAGRQPPCHDAVATGRRRSALRFASKGECVDLDSSKDEHLVGPVAAFVLPKWARREKCFPSGGIHCALPPYTVPGTTDGEGDV